jgi:superfamily II DNA or RNA helicase
MLGSYLPLKNLHAALPIPQVEQLCHVLRRLDALPPNYNPLNDRAFLGRLYDAYFGAEVLLRARDRRELLDFVPADKLAQLANHLGLNTDGTFEQVVRRVTELPWGRNDHTAKFLDFFGYPSEYLPEPDEDSPTMEVVAPYGQGLRSLYDYQSSVYFRALEKISTPCARLLIQMPTGSGKTRTAMELVSAFLNKFPDKVVLWVSHSEELCEQAVASFLSVWRYLGHNPVTLHRCWGRHSVTSPVSSPAIIVAGFAKLHSLRRDNQPAPKADLIVIDEAHMILAPTFHAAVSWAKGINARAVGLTATPGRGTGGEGQNKALSEYFFGEIVGIHTEGTGVIEFLQGRGILSRLEREALRTELTFRLTTQEWRTLEEELDFPADFLKRVAEDIERNRIIVERLWTLADQGARTLLFAGSVEQSRILCASLLFRGIPAAHIDGGTSPETRRAVIAKFRRGELLFLCNYGVLATGFDAPKTDVVFIARPTKSIVLYSQMIGRGLRGPSVGGTAICRVVDVIDNIVDYSGDLDDVYEYFQEYWAN